MLKSYKNNLLRRLTPIKVFRYVSPLEGRDKWLSKKLFRFNDLDFDHKSRMIKKDVEKLPDPQAFFLYFLMFKP